MGGKDVAAYVPVEPSVSPLPAPGPRVALTAGRHGPGPHFQLQVSPTPLPSLWGSNVPRRLLVTCLVSGGSVV